jgi:hypothetical protein
MELDSLPRGYHEIDPLRNKLLYTKSIHLDLYCVEVVIPHYAFICRTSHGIGAEIALYCYLL